MKIIFAASITMLLLCSCSDVEYRTYVTPSPTSTKYSIWYDGDSITTTSGDTILKTRGTDCISTVQMSDGMITLEMVGWKSASLETVLGSDEVDCGRATSSDSGQVATVCK